MFTQCPKCETVFRISSEQLKMREGLVRCGDCAEVFNASWHLIDDVDVPTLQRDGTGQTDTAGADAGADELASPLPSLRAPGRPRARDRDDENDSEPGPGFGDDQRIFELDHDLAEELDLDDSSLEQLTPDDIRAALEDDENLYHDRGPSDPARAAARPRPPAKSAGHGRANAPQAPSVPPESGSRPSRARSGAGAGTAPRAEPRLAPPARIAGDTDEDDSGDRDQAHAPAEDDEMVMRPGRLSVPSIDRPVPETPPEPRPVRRSRVPRQLREPAAAGERRAASDGRERVEIRPAITPMQKPEYARLRVGGPGWERSRRQPETAGRFFALVGSLLLIGLLAVQVRFVLIEELAAIPSARPWLSLFCAMAACDVPTRQEPARIDLAQTRVDLHPDVPGALRVRIHVVNRGRLPQPYPSIQLTLSDKDGRVVGRRTYHASDYLGDDGDRMLAPGIMSVVTLNLAHPDDNAVGFQADVVSG
jgi:predicted Zn finger-like uncharacterized protein